MRKVIIFFTTIVMIMLLGACSNDEVLPETKPETGRTLSFTATMPDDDPATRVSLTPKTDSKNIELKWESTDEIQLLFVQKVGVTVTKRNVKVGIKNISENGKTAQFDISLPDGISPTGTFDLHGVYGRGTLGADGKVELSKQTYQGTSLATIGARKDVMLTFASTGIDATNPIAKVEFKHLGSLFSITVKNNSAEEIGLHEATLESASSLKWAYDPDNTKNDSYDLVSGKFIIEGKNNGLYFALTNGFESIAVPSQSTLTFWVWSPPLGVDWPELSLEVKGNAFSKTSTNTKPAKTPIPGKAYYFYAAWDGEALKFTDSKFLGPDEYFVENGDLATQLQGKEASIERLILTGELDKPDFEVMKLRLPNLKYVDLKNARCKNNLIPYEAFGNLGGKGYEPNKTITTIILPTSITRINYEAFANCTALSGNLVIPNEVTIIEKNAYDGCTGLAGTLSLPDNLTSIGESAFKGCSGFTGNLTIPAGVTTIGITTFYGCTGLDGLTLHNNITSIGASAFNGCSGFTGQLTLPNKLTKIESSTFSGCTKLTGALTIPAGVTTIGTFAFYKCEGFNSLALPNELTSIDDYAFSGCSKLIQTLVTPEKVTSIGKWAFMGCSGFTALTLQNGITSIGASAFQNCKGFKGNLTIPTKVTIINDEVFSGCSGFTSLTLHNNITSIGARAFLLCSGFTGPLVLPTGLKTIGDAAFSTCIGFTGPLTIPDGVTVINRFSFYGCKGFDSLTLHDNITSIGEEAFLNCSNITGPVVFSINLGSIGAKGFSECINVGYFKFPHTTPIVHTDLMLLAGAKVHVPPGSLGAYNIDKWNSRGYIFSEYKLVVSTLY